MDQVAVQQQGMDLQQALTELELLRQDNAALLEAVSQQQLSAHVPALLCHPRTHTRRQTCFPTSVQLRLAQLGGVDLQGHLSKFNPDAAEQGIFTQDWELRYFVLSGALSVQGCLSFSMPPVFQQPLWQSKGSPSDWTSTGPVFV